MGISEGIFLAASQCKRGISYLMARISCNTNSDLMHHLVSYRNTRLVSSSPV